MNKYKKYIILLFLFSSYIQADLLDVFSGPLLRPLLRKINPNRFNSLSNPNLQNPYLVYSKDIKDTFDSVIVNDEITKQFKLIVEFLKHPQKMMEIGAKIPKGVLMYGPPGTGKTSLGRALAKEANCNFLYLPGSEIDDMFVGTGAQKIKDIFQIARHNAPAIIFVDEIDTIAKKRLSVETRHHTQTIQQLLVEMDGFKQNEKPIVVIGTTNNLKDLDKSLLRSGRFDLHIEINLPTPENQKKILLMYLKKVKVDSDVKEEDLDSLIKRMQKFSGADIENLVNQASINAVSNGRNSVNLQDLNKSLDELKKQKSETETPKFEFY